MLSKIDVADVPSCPVFDTDALDGLLVGEVIRKFAFDSPIVQAARPDLAAYNRTKRQHAAFNGIFEGGFFLWPLNLTVSALDGFFRPAILHDEEVRWGPLPQGLEAAFAHVAGSFSLVMQALGTNRVALVDMNNNPVHASLWRGPGITIDLKTSDLYEIGMEQWRQDNPGGGLLRRRLWLSVPVSAAAPSENAALRKPKATANGSGAGLQRASRSGPKPRYDGERLKEDVARHVKSNGPFPLQENLVDWCSGFGIIKLRAGKQPPKDKAGKPSEGPDLHTVKDLIKKHGIASMKGVIAKR
jgi:hypothetical protein